MTFGLYTKIILSIVMALAAGNSNVSFYLAKAQGKVSPLPLQEFNQQFVDSQTIGPLRPKEMPQYAVILKVGKDFIKLKTLNLVK